MQCICSLHTHQYWLLSHELINYWLDVSHKKEHILCAPKITLIFDMMVALINFAVRMIVILIISDYFQPTTAFIY